MKSILAVSLAIVAILAAVVVAWLVRVDRRLAKAPRTIEQSFATLGEGWDLPPIQPARYDAYWVAVHYAKGRPGRLSGSLALRIIDQTTGEPVSVEWHGGKAGDEFEIVTRFEPRAGHRYRVEVEPDAVKELSAHTLQIMPTSAEINNWVRDALLR